LKTLGNIFIALGILVIGFPTLLVVASGESPIKVIDEFMQLFPPLVFILFIGSLAIIPLGIILSSIGRSKQAKKLTTQSKETDI
jgi:hypothetical protein